VKDGDAAKILLGFAALGLVIAIGSGGSVTSSSWTPTYASGSLPDLPGLRQREAAEPGFISALLGVIQETGADGDKLAALISEESGFKPDALEPGDGGSGFLQWLPRYAPAYTGYTADELRQMTGIQQLEAVRNTIIRSPGYKTDPAIAGGGWKVSLPDDAIVIPGGTSTYSFFHNYDRGQKGYVTAGDVRAYVYGRLFDASGNPIGRISV